MTKIEFALPHTSFVKLEIFNTLGRSIRTLINEKMQAGYQAVVWDGLNDDGDNVSTGVYFYRLETDQNIETKKMLLLK